MLKVIEDMAEIVGEGKAMEIAIRWAGRSLSVPGHINPEHPISLTIGFEAAKKLCAAYGPGRIDMPLERSIIKGVRDKRIYEDAVINGRSHTSLAHEYGISRGHVTYIVNRLKDEHDPA